MALTVKQLNGDASFLLTFEPIVGEDLSTSIFSEPFRILLDPWLKGPSHELHPRISRTSHNQPALFPSLFQLPVPDVVVISQDKRDHCNEATLRQLPGTGTKTIILAEPAAARRIQSWKHFDEDKVIPLPRWEDPRQTGHETVARISVPAQALGGDTGEVTIAFVPQRRDFRNQHPAIGITYRPPTARPSRHTRNGLARPATPSSPISTIVSLLSAPRSSATDPTPTIRPVMSLLPTPPTSPSLRSKRSTASLTPHLQNRTVSILFAPHGTTYSSIEPYATSHLVNEAALPLTTLLHCFDDIEGPWWCPGSTSLRSKGMAAGVETAAALGARVWLSAHDGEKEAKGLFRKGVRRRRHGILDIRREIEDSVTGPGGHRSTKNITEIMALGIGDEVTMTSEGIWDAEPGSASAGSSRDSEERQSVLRKYGMDDVLAGISSEPFSQPQRKSPTTTTSKLHIETCASPPAEA